MKTIGFTNVYYTLWEVGEPYEEKQYYAGMCIGSVTKQSCVYCQNLSIDLEKAKEKLAGQQYEIDLELRGHSSFNRIIGSDIKNREDYYPHDQFSFGRMEGVSFREATDTWQLFRAMKEERSRRRRVHARRRLIELGELVRYPHQEYFGYVNVNWGKKDFEGNPLPEKEVEDIRLRNYATPKFVAKEEEKKMNAHYFSEKEKVELEVMLIHRFHFDTFYGTTYGDVFKTKDNKIVKYLGSNPPSLDGLPEWFKIKGTIKHTMYDGKPETHIQRIKIVG